MFARGTGSMTRRLGGPGALLVSFGLMVSVLAAPAQAATKTYTAAISPTTAGAGSAGAYAITITDGAGSGQDLGSANVSVPTGFTSVVVGTVTTPPGKVWTAALVSGVIQLRNPGPNSVNRLKPGQSVTVALTATAPTAPGAYTWTTAAKQSNDFNGAGNELTRSGPDPVVTVGSGPLASIQLTPSSSSITAGGSQAYTATGYDGAGNIVGDVTASTTFTISPDGSCTAATCTATVAGAHIVTGVDGSFSSTANLTVGGGPASALVVAIQGTAPSTPAGQPASLAITAQDSYGNIATTYTGTITFTSSDPQADLPAAYAFTGAGTGHDNGSHTFTIILKTAGSQSITVTDVANSLSGTQSGISVTPGDPALLVFGQQPTNVLVNGSIAPAVTVIVQDAYGNVVTSSTAAVTLGIGNDPNGGTLHGTSSCASGPGTVCQNAVAGIATFGDLSVDVAGTGYTLAATSPGLTSVTSAAFDVEIVLAPCPAQGCFGSTGSDTNANTTTNASVTVPARQDDGFLSITSDPASVPAYARLCGGTSCLTGSSIMTVVPPTNSPYVQGDIVTVVLEYDKSVSGNRGASSFKVWEDGTLLSNCSDVGGVAPCVQKKNRDNAGDLLITIFITSNDPHIGTR
jgi:hypothetical protein